MSTAAQVRTAWDTNVFQHSSIQAITTKIYDREMRKDEGSSKSQYNLLRFGQEINFIEYVVTRFPNGGEVGARRYQYQVEVSYYRELEKDSTNHNAVIDAFESIDTRVIDGLGFTWGATVDFASQDFESPSIEQITIEGKQVLKVSRVYEAEKYITS